jgi:hypothetical protein
MLWREEQRAIDEMMRQDGVEAGCISFASFATTYEDRFSRWFTEFAADLEDPSSPASDRLANLHRVTARLVRELDVTGRSSSSTRRANSSTHDGLVQRPSARLLAIRIPTTAGRFEWPPRPALAVIHQGDMARCAQPEVTRDQHT